MPLRALVRTRQLFLILFLLVLHFLGWEVHFFTSLAQESILDQGPKPDTVEGLQGPLDVPFIPLAPVPWLFTKFRDGVRDALEPQLEPLPSFFRDTRLTFKPRMYYFNRDNNLPGASDNHDEAWTVGGSLDYQSGWWRDLVSIGAEVFTSQKQYGPLDRDGTTLLRKRQNEYTVVGRAYGELKYDNYAATLFRQYLDTPYMNKQDNRMTPNTFEAYKLVGRYRWIQFAVAYIDKIKRRNSSAFISLAEAAGAPEGRDRGAIAAGARLTPSEDVSVGAINYTVPDVFNIAYAEANYAQPVTEQFRLKLQTQFTDQRDVGGDKLIGAFDTRVISSQAAVSYKNIIFRSAFSIVSSEDAIRSPFGTYPGYISLIEKDFNRAGETAWLLGFSYDFKRFITGLHMDFNYAQGFSARDPATGKALPDESEVDVTIDYRIQSEWLRGFWIRLRNGYVNFDRKGGSINDTRLIINYELPVL